MFIDQVKIKVTAGNGGNGAVAFRREKYIANGGPAGGDGGNGGSVIFVADEGLSTLLDLRYNRVLQAKNGENGMAKSCHGKNSDDLIVKVPVGTIVYDNTTNLIIADLTENGQRAVIAKGGRGGRGNIHFATPRNTAPELAENGELGQKREVRVELKVLADVGLVGFPSVGKSTLISVVSACKPKIAAYHFTTLVPNLGVVGVPDGRSFVMADLPGLIEGAASGAGLGHQFLRHIERTRVILHVIDMSGMEGRDPYEDYVTINNELAQYRYKLLERPQIIVANKMDEAVAEENLVTLKEKLAEYYANLDRDVPEIFEISAWQNKGIKPLLQRAYDLVQNSEFISLHDEVEEKVHYTLEEETPFEIEEIQPGHWLISGSKIEKLYAMTNMVHDESIARFARQLRGMGIDEQLRKLGAESGDTVQLSDYFFEFMD